MFLCFDERSNEQSLNLKEYAVFYENNSERKQIKVSALSGRRAYKMVKEWLGETGGVIRVYAKVNQDRYALLIDEGKEIYAENFLL